MRKPVYLAVSGISVVVAAVSLGVTLTHYLGLRAYVPKGAAQAAATAARPNASPTPAEEWNNLFAPGDGMKMASRLPAANADPQATRASFVLVGTIVSSSPAARRAVLWADGMKEPKAFRESEEIEPGTFLASVERDKAWIVRGSEREKLEILPVGSRARPTGTAAFAGGPSAPYPGPQSASSGDVPPRKRAINPSGPPPGRTQARSPKASPRGRSEDAVNPPERRKRPRGSQP